jgi:hypothetical protein
VLLPSRCSLVSHKVARSFMMMLDKNEKKGKNAFCLNFSTYFRAGIDYADFAVSTSVNELLQTIRSMVLEFSNVEKIDAYGTRVTRILRAGAGQHTALLDVYKDLTAILANGTANIILEGGEEMLTLAIATPYNYNTFCEAYIREAIANNLQVYPLLRNCSEHTAGDCVTTFNRHEWLGVSLPQIFMARVTGNTAGTDDQVKVEAAMQRAILGQTNINGRVVYHQTTQ